MKLQRVVIDGFRSIASRVTFHVRPTLTCLIGANEHGKSNILDAVEKLNRRTFDEFDRYSSSADTALPKITYWFQFSSAERRQFLEVLRKDIAAAEAAVAKSEAQDGSPADIAKKRSLVKMNQATLDHYQSATEADFSISISEASCKLDVKRMHYTMKADPTWQLFLGSPLPEIRLFTASHELADKVTLVELEARSNLPFEGLLKLGGVWDDRETLFRGDIIADRVLVRAGKVLTRKLRSIWSQGSKHTFRLSESNGYLRFSIEDPVTFDTPSRRSLGFRSFLAFALTVYAETESLDPEGFVLLFDEPGIHLHPQGQKDLLREIRRLSTRNQIIYTTHSPFMIDRNDLDATILVRKEAIGKEKGTKLVYRPYSANWASLNSALGMSPSDTFFPPDKSLLVEGSSDRAYLLRYLGLTSEKTKADLNFLHIVDADRREEVEAVARILLTAGREAVVLGDGDQGGRDLERWLKRIAGKNRTRLHFIDLRAVAGVNKPVAVEDLLPQDLWLDAVELWLREVLDESHAINRSDLQVRAQTLTIGRATADYLVEVGILRKHNDFSKTNVADFFCRGNVPTPASDDPMFRLCLEVSRRLNLAV